MAKDSLAAVCEGDDESCVRHALACSILSAAAVEAGLSTFVYLATLLRGTSGDPGSAFYKAVEAMVLRSAHRAGRSPRDNPLGDSPEQYFRAVEESHLGVRVLLDIVMLHCETMEGHAELGKKVHQLLDDRNDLLHRTPRFMDDNAYADFHANRPPGHWVLPALPVNGAPPFALDFPSLDTKALENATLHLDVAHEFLKLLGATWRKPSGSPG